jgi:hypothetical protein
MSWGELPMGRVVHGASCPWGECPWGELPSCPGTGGRITCWWFYVIKSEAFLMVSDDEKW